MEISFPKCETILKTLPIGYYTGRRIEIEMSRDEETSCYSPMEDKIIISYPIIAYRMAQIEDDCNEEEAVRSMLYHEVSHAILTPICLPPSFENNCFEDERIETVLRHYYEGVDFRKQLYDVHGGHAPKATDYKSAVFNAVRFGLGTAEVQKRINELFKDFAHLNRNSTMYGWEEEHAWSNVDAYETQIRKICNLIRNEFKSNPEAFNEQNGSGEGKAKQMDKMKASNEQSSGSGEHKKGKSETEQQEDGSAEEENTNNSKDFHEVEIDKEQLKKMVGQCMCQDSNLSEAQIEQLNSFQRTVETIIGNFNKKNSGGSGINAYSGVFNPRAVSRKDYRFFDRSMSTQGNNRFGTCHLNLIIDCSGSYADNEAITNGILRVLSEVERKNRNFSMDVGFINHNFRMANSIRERRFVAEGGDTIPNNMGDILRNLQKPQTCNYNIVLFDGDAICGSCGDKDPNKVFSVFDRKQTTLITDPDNERYMKPPFKATKVIVTTDYANKLIEHITKALTIAFG